MTSYKIDRLFIRFGTCASPASLLSVVVHCLLLFGAFTQLAAQEPLVRNVDFINSQMSEYSPAYFGDQLVYVHQAPNGRIDPKSKLPFFELFIAPAQNERRKKSKRFKIELNSAYHEGPISFSKDRRQVFFTKTNTKKGVSVASATGEAKLKIYYAYMGQYDWEGVRELPINDDDKNTLHPSLSADGNRIFFASDREADGFGGLDLYFSEWINGQWTKPINLGPEVNTSKDECYPFIHDSGQLFFASDRKGGFGKMDLYTIDLSGRNWGKVYRLPPPYNTEADDFGMILAEDAKSGYLSSNRKGGKGEDDIYQFSAPNGLKSFTGNPLRQEVVSVYDAGNSVGLAQARIFLTEINSPGSDNQEARIIRNGDGTFGLTTVSTTPLKTEERQFQTDQQGGVEIPLREGRSYRLLIHKAGYLPQTVRFTYTSSGPSRPLELVLQKGDCMVVSGTIRSQRNNDPLAKAELILKPLSCGGPAVKTMTESDGYYFVCIPANCDYELTATHHNYLDTRSAFNASTKVGSYQEFNLVMLPKPSMEEADLSTLQPNSVIVLNDLQYNDDRYELSSPNILELKLLSKLLLSNPNLTVRLENHTETGGPDTYLQEISQQRVLEIQNYLINTGVSSSRIKTTAHGGRVPRHDCGQPVNCNPSQHRANRRTEVRILSR